MTNSLLQYDIFQDGNKIPLIKVINEIDLSDYRINVLVANSHYFQEVMEIICGVLDIGNMESEHLYVIALDSDSIIKGIYLLGLGNPEGISAYEQRSLVMFLVLIGSVSFFTIHNHPNDVLKESESDTVFDAMIKGAGSVVGIKCIGNYAVTNDGYIDIFTKEVKYFV